MKVLSLFDGISCGQLALERAGVKVKQYYASEIKPIAIKVTMEHHPNTIQIGDVTKIHYKDGILYTEKGDFEVGHIDLLIGGSPCQDFSCANWSNSKTKSKNYGLGGAKSGLFYHYLRLKEEIKPTYFLLENVKMKNSSKLELDDYLGVEGMYINSELVSFQKRARFYWTNIPNVTIPKDRGISYQDYRDYDEIRCNESTPNWTPSRIRMWNNGENTIGGRRQCKNITNSTKVGCLLRKQDRSPNSGMVEYKGIGRYLTRRELELAQTLPIGYCDGLSYAQTCDVCGDGWTVDVIAHIFSFLKTIEED